jgi:hypothetical protein
MRLSLELFHSSFGRLNNNTASHAFISFSGTNYNNYDINFKINGSTLYMELLLLVRQLILIIFFMFLRYRQEI